MDRAFTLSRRVLIVGAVGLCSLSGKALAQADPAIEGAEPPLPGDLAPFASAPAYRPSTTSSLVGANAARPEEVVLGRSILGAAPVATTPIAVARYFLELGQRRNDPRAAYVREWPIRANPVIQSFFAATRTVPQGDLTPWCAAFVNWCIARAKSTDPTAGLSRNEGFTAGALGKTTRSSASGSFRCWTETADPQPGDLVVFRQPNSNQRCGGKGHVAFYAGAGEPGYIRILGGNQLLRGTSGAVTLSRYPRDGGEGGRLRFLGFRTSTALR